MTNNTRIDLTVPYVEQEDAKASGTRWDSLRKFWYAPQDTNLENLRRWLPGDVQDCRVDQGAFARHASIGDTWSSP